jgi:hypothetical protein
MVDAEKLMVDDSFDEVEKAPAEGNVPIRRRPDQAG